MFLAAHHRYNIFLIEEAAVVEVQIKPPLTRTRKSLPTLITRFHVLLLLPPASITKDFIDVTNIRW